jgi:6-phosphogluconolactonase/glucosamine-6-phosphate isomerase/deaminase
MQYIYSADAQLAIEHLVQRITTLLNEGKKVLWLVSGGSGGKVTVEVSKELLDTNLKDLYVTLSDERYGDVDHANENWNLLLQDGLLLPGATLYRPLQGLSRQKTTERYNEWITDTTKSVNYVIGIFGIGSDGHTAGIKPYSDVVEAEAFVADFTGEDFERMTITPAYFDHIDEAVIQAFGADKHAVIQQLQTQELFAAAQPAQLLKNIPVATFYSDYKEAA